MDAGRRRRHRELLPARQPTAYRKGDRTMHGAPHHARCASRSQKTSYFPVLVQEPIRVCRATTSELGYGLSQANLTRSRQFRVCACGCLHVQTLRFNLLMSSRSRCCRACRCCSLQTKHVMCFAPAFLKYTYLSLAAKYLRDNMAVHAAQGTISQSPHMSTRVFCFVSRKADKPWYVPHFVHVRSFGLLFFLRLCSRCCRCSSSCSLRSWRSSWRTLRSWRSSWRSCCRCSRSCNRAAYCCCFWQTRHARCFASPLKYLRISQVANPPRDNIASHAAHCTNSQLPHMSTRSLLLVHRKADKVLYIPHFLQFFLVLRTVDADASATTSAVSLRTVDADASVTISAASPGDRVQSNRISSKFRCGR